MRLDLKVVNILLQKKYIPFGIVTHILLHFCSIFILSKIAMSDPLDFKIWNNIESQKSLLLSNNKTNFYDKSLGLQLIKKSEHSLFNITLNHVHNKLTFDQSRF